jgi:putative modified peptide
MSEEEASRIEVSMELTSAEAFEFLTRLATDDDFRERLQSDPVPALSEYHITVSDPRLVANVTLPPKADVQQLLDNLEANDYAAAGAQFAPYGPVLPLVPHSIVVLPLPPPPPPPQPPVAD